MNNKFDYYNKLVDFIGNIIKSTNNQNDQKDIDNTLDIAHTVGNTLKVIADKNDNTVSQYENDNQ